MKKTKILFEGHDLKFLSHIIAHYETNHDYDVAVFTYSGHEIKDTTEIQCVLPDLDIIFCEWGLGNLRWFSQNKLPGQKIITRIHSQEFFTGYLQETHWSQVSKIVFVSQHMLRQFCRLFPGSSDKCVMIHNMVDCELYKKKKTDDAKYHLGLLGVLPRLKDPNLGLQILKELKKEDQRYKLFIKGTKPHELDWLWKKAEEQQYYNDFVTAVADLKLEDSVIWEPHGNDVPEWFTKIGFILSCSDREAFHMAVAEGMASGSIPVIRQWEGSQELYPKEYSFMDVQGAAALIRKFTVQKNFDHEATKARQYCEDHFDVKIIVPEYDKLMFPEYDIVEVRREYYNVSELGKKLAIDHEICEKAREKTSADLSNLIIQQKGLTESNSILTAELSHIRKDLIMQQEANQRLAVSFEQLQQANQGYKYELINTIQENQRKVAELQSKQLINDADNTTAKELASAEIQSGENIAFSTGTGINQNPGS